ncbi:MAG: hypothetical protein WAT51_00125 [Holophaga sp.]
MRIAIAIFMVTALNAVPPQLQAPPVLKKFLEAQSLAGPSETSLAYRVEYKSFHKSKPKDVFKDSGEMPIGTTNKGEVWVGAPHGLQALTVGETTHTEGQRWFNQLCESSRLAPLANPVGFLGRLIDKLKFKDVTNPPEGVGEPGDQIFIFTLEAPRPVAKFWTFKAKADEVRLHIRKNGCPVSMEVIQSYEGRLSPHFGLYALTRKETWAFVDIAGQVRTKNFRLSLQRQDWNEAFEAHVEMKVGALK